MMNTNELDYDTKSRVIGTAMFDLDGEVNTFDYTQKVGEWDFSKACVTCIALEKEGSFLALMVITGCNNIVDDIQQNSLVELLHKELLDCIKAYGDDFPVVCRRFLQIDADKLDIDWVYTMREEFKLRLRVLEQDEAVSFIGDIQGNA